MGRKDTEIQILHPKDCRDVVHSKRKLSQHKEDKSVENQNPIDTHKSKKVSPQPDRLYYH